MKHLKIAFLAFALIASYSNVNAQDENHPWSLNFGTNFIDVVTDSDKSSGYFGSYDIGGNNVNVLGYLSSASLGRYLGKGFILELAADLNRIDKPWGGSGDMTFFGLDLNIKYDLNNAFGDTGWWNPYLYAGVGENWVGSDNGIGFNFGAGMNFWFNDNWGLYFMSGYKKVNTDYDFDMYQHKVGVVWQFGNSDTDGDGIRDKDDKCPTLPGPAEFEGCPDMDSDNDGIGDCCDACPDVPGVAEFDGCPDTDGDGIPDSKDLCPEEKGEKKTKGCPDSDGDGVADKDDACPEIAGPATNAGCPFKDTDGDGVLDIVDKCVDVKGPAENDGCPVVEDVMEAIKALARTVYFQTGKSSFTDETYGRLDAMYNIMKDFPDAKFHVEGHADSTGSDAVNDRLSNERANAVRDYLVSKGLNGAHFTAQGYGETQPIDSNDTASGRANNRRVEIKLAE